MIGTIHTRWLKGSCSVGCRVFLYLKNDRLCNSSTMQICGVSKQQPVDIEWKWMSALWCLSFQRGVGIFSTGMRWRCSIGNIDRLFNWTFLFMIPASPRWIHWTVAWETNTVSGGAGRGATVRGRISFPRASIRKYPDPSCLLYYSAPLNLECGVGGLWGHYTKITKKTPAPIMRQ